MWHLHGELWACHVRERREPTEMMPKEKRDASCHMHLYAFILSFPRNQAKKQKKKSFWLLANRVSVAIQHSTNSKLTCFFDLTCLLYFRNVMVSNEWMPTTLRSHSFAPSDPLCLEFLLCISLSLLLRFLSCSFAACLLVYFDFVWCTRSTRFAGTELCKIIGNPTDFYSRRHTTTFA